MTAKTEKWKGRIKQATGNLTGNRRLEDQGSADRRSGEAKERLATVRGKVDKAIDKATRSIEHALDSGKGKRHRG